METRRRHRRGSRPRGPRHDRRRAVRSFEPRHHVGCGLRKRQALSRRGRRLLLRSRCANARDRLENEARRQFSGGRLLRLELAGASPREDLSGSLEQLRQPFRRGRSRLPGSRDGDGRRPGESVADFRPFAFRGGRLVLARDRSRFRIGLRRDRVGVPLRRRPRVLHRPALSGRPRGAGLLEDHSRRLCRDGRPGLGIVPNPVPRRERAASGRREPEERQVLRLRSRKPCAGARLGNARGDPRPVPAVRPGKYFNGGLRRNLALRGRREHRLSTLRPRWR